MKNYAMAGNSMNVLARLVAVVAMAGLLGTGSLASAKSAPLPEKLQGNYSSFSLLYFVNGKQQSLVTVMAEKPAVSVPALAAFVEVGSAGLVAVNFTDVVSTAGIVSRLIFTEGLKPAGTTSSSGTVRGSLQSNQGLFLVKSGTYRATLDGAGLRLIVQMNGTLGLGAAAADKAASAFGGPGHAVINILLRKTSARR
jgi:hypothetical protein